MKIFIITLALLSAVSAINAADLTSFEKRFIQKAAAGNSAEVKLAQLAQQKSQDSKVKVRLREVPAVDRNESERGFVARFSCAELSPHRFHSNELPEADALVR